MRREVIDESSFVSGAQWEALWREEHEHGKRKRWSGEHVMFTLDLDEKTTFSWLERDPEYAKPRELSSYGQARRGR